MYKLPKTFYLYTLKLLRILDESSEIGGYYQKNACS